MLKRGDRVKVREDLEVGKIYGGCLFVDAMERYLGRTYPILGEGAWAASFCLAGRGINRFDWTEEMLIKLRKPRKTKRVSGFHKLMFGGFDVCDPKSTKKIEDNTFSFQVPKGFKVIEVVMQAKEGK